MTGRMKQGVVWGSMLILLGVLSLVDQFVPLGPWPWVGMFAVIGVLAFVLFLTDRSDWSMLLGAYIVWAIGLLIALVSLDILRDEAVAFFVIPKGLSKCILASSLTMSSHSFTLFGV